MKIPPEPPPKPPLPVEPVDPPLEYICLCGHTTTDPEVAERHSRNERMVAWALFTFMFGVMPIAYLLMFLSGCEA